MTPVDPDELLRDALGSTQEPIPRAPLLLLVTNPGDIFELWKLLDEHGVTMRKLPSSDPEAPIVHELVNNAPPDQMRL
jgi:hypothetical protein